MLLSMTGYGRAGLEVNGKRFTVEVKTLNSKGLDVNLRLHTMFREKEMDIRQLVVGCIGRGKADVTINNAANEDNRNGELNPSVIRSYMEQLQGIAGDLGLGQEKLFELTLQLPNVSLTTPDVLKDDQWQLVKDAIEAACKELYHFREQEGKSMAADLHERNRIILEVLAGIEALNPERLGKARERLDQSLSGVGDDLIDRNRLEQELIFYVEKMDINEEITRLRSHCNYFTEVMENDLEEKGKKLAFISQEMGREINTIGSKSYHAGMQKLVVEMKDELEKIKEQLNNVL